MQKGWSLEESLRTLRQHTGIVIPTFAPPNVDASLSRQLLEDTVHACVQQVDDPMSICLSVDGENCGKDMAEELASHFGVMVCSTPENKGKLHALRNGVDRIFAESKHRYLATLDADGDHFPNELVNLLRAANHIQRSRGIEKLLVLGRRISRHHPMGYLRGELEELADRVLLDALAYDASLRGHPLRFEYATSLEEFPDFHSGYKVFSRSVVRDVFLEEPILCGVSQNAYYKHGVEAVMTVEAIKSGAYLVGVNRSTLNEQPLSVFGLLNRIRVTADKILWPCRRLEVPSHFVVQWLRNHMARLQLGTLAPQGKDELRQIRQLVLKELGAPAVEDEEGWWGPLFI